MRKLHSLQAMTLSCGPEKNVDRRSLDERFRESTRCCLSGVCAALVTACIAGPCRGAGVLDPQGPISSAERLILLNATAIMLVVVLPVIVLTLAFAWWYRASNARAAYRPDWSYSGHIELVVWSIPAMVVILLGAVTWTGSHVLDPARKLESDTPPIRIEVVSLDWKWLFIYPDQQVAAVNQLVVPAGTPIEFMSTSATVMNDFFVPQLGSQIYTMPGMATRLNLLADLPGDYPGLAAHFSGDGFSDMRFIVHAVPGSQFPGWLARVRAAGMALDADTYSQLARPGSNAKMQTYGSIDPNLFERIVQQTTQLAPAPRKGGLDAR
jgi:cytochrome o ubiquinol oxidase subunit II